MSFRKGDEILDMLSLQLQQFDLLLQRLFSVEGGIRQDPLNVFQRKFQFPEQQDLLQMFQRCIVIQAVARFGVPVWVQQADFIVILQGAYTHAGQAAYFTYGHHGFSLLPLRQFQRTLLRNVRVKRFS